MQDAIAKLQQSLEQAGFKGAFMEGGPAMMHFTGVRWGRSERTFAVVIPAKGAPAFVVPGFEEQRARELVKQGTEVRVWQEEESPFQLIVDILRERGVTAGKVALDDFTRFFIVDGVRKLAPKLELTSGQAIFAALGVPERMERRPF